MALLAAFAKFISDIDIHFAISGPRGLFQNVRTFDWGSQWPSGLILAIGAIAFLTGHILEYRGWTNKVIRFFGFVEFTCSLYILYCGLWGVVALRAALAIFHLGVDEPPWAIAARGQAALTLYSIQGRILSYIAFVALPLLFITVSLVRWLAAKNPPPTLLGRGFTMCACVSFLGIMVAAQVGHLKWMIEYMKFNIFNTGSPIDKQVFGCTSPFVGNIGNANTEALVGCYETGTAAWEAEIARISGMISQRLKSDKRRLRAFSRDSQTWHARQTSNHTALFKRVGANSDLKLQLAEARYRSVSERGKVLQSYLK
jgi:hypothetical protein